jgi:hypothetical protein
MKTVINYQWRVQVRIANHMKMKTVDTETRKTPMREYRKMEETSS